MKKHLCLLFSSISFCGIIFSIGDTLSIGQQLVREQILLSANKAIKLKMQSDGNLVLSRFGDPYGTRKHIRQV